MRWSGRVRDGLDELPDGASQYALAIISLLALRAGWCQDQVAALGAGGGTGDEKTDSLIAVVREAAGNSGRVGDATWDNAIAHGWGDEQLAEAFGYLGLTVFTSYFLNYAAIAARRARGSRDGRRSRLRWN